MLSFSSHWFVKNGCHQDDACPFPEANHCYCPSSTFPCQAVIWFPFCLLVWRADLRFMCATVSGTLVVTWTTAGMKRMLQHLQQSVNKGSISKVTWIIIYLPSLKIFHHNFPLPSSLLKIRKKHFPKTLCHKKCNKPCHWFHWKHRQFGKWSWSMSVMCDMFRKCSPQ